MTNIQKLRQLRKEAAALSEQIMAHPSTSEEEFEEAFRQRDLNYVEGLIESGMDEGEARWETMAGCNGNDSPYHTYFGL